MQLPDETEVKLLRALQPIMGLTESILAEKLNITTRQVKIQLVRLREKRLVFYFQVEGFWRISHEGLVALGVRT